MQISITYDQSQSSLPAGFVSAVNYVVNYFDTTFTNPVTVNIDLGYGEIANQSLGPNALGESETLFYSFPYSTAINALDANGTSATQQTADATIPGSSPLSGGTLWISMAEEKALGLLAADNSAIDGYVGISNSFPFSYSTSAAPASSQYYFIGVLAHEFSEVMGRDSLLGEGLGDTTSYSLMDLFRYAAPGTRQLGTGGPAYFSINNGATNLDSWNTNPQGDLGDWDASAGNDSFLAFSPQGQTDWITQADLTLMDVLGWDQAPQLPDLTCSVIIQNATVVAGGSLTIQSWVSDQGNAAAPSSTTGYYLSSTSTITTADTLLATRVSGPLAPVGTPGYYDNENITVTLPGNLTPGTYYIGGIANYDGAVAESNTTNNTHNVVAITVTAAQAQTQLPDLTCSVVISNATVAAGGTLTIQSWVSDQGGVAAPSSTTGYYLSTDPTITTADTLLATKVSGPLAPVGTPGYYDNENITVTLPGNLTPGTTYYIGGIANYNGQVAESNTTNNTHNVVAITITAPQAQPLPDLTCSVILPNTTIAAGGSLLIESWVSDQGSVAAPASTTGYYLSTDPTITTADTLLATKVSGSLAPVGTPGYYDNENIAVTLPGNLTPGTYYIGGIANYNGAVAESNTTNNTHNVVAITVTAPQSGSGAAVLTDEYDVPPNHGAGGNTPVGTNIGLLNNYMAAAFPSSGNSSLTSPINPSDSAPVASLAAGHTPS